MGIAFLWLKYKLNYTKARALRVTVLLGYVEITITVYSISQDMVFVNDFILYVDLSFQNTVGIRILSLVFCDFANIIRSFFVQSS